MLKDDKPTLTQHTSSSRPHTDFSLINGLPLLSYKQNPCKSDTVLFLCIVGPKCFPGPNPESTNTLRSSRVCKATFKCPTQSRLPCFWGAWLIFHSWMVFYLFFCRCSALTRAYCSGVKCVLHCTDLAFFENVTGPGGTKINRNYKRAALERLWMWGVNQKVQTNSLPFCI